MKLLVLLLVSCFMLAGCQGVEKTTCTARDWYELGRRSGAVGEQSADLVKEVKSCGEEARKNALMLFRSGRNAGLAQYCSPENGFELGRVNQPYKYVCPPQLEREFLNSYKRGKKLYGLKSKNASLRVKINDLQMLQVIENEQNKKQSLLKELSQLKKALRRNNQLIKKLSKTEII